MTRPIMPTLYLAGPMTGLPDYNRPAFHDAAAQLRAAGFAVLNPAETELPPGQDSWANYMRAGLRQVLEADALALLPGWDRSNGAQLERHVATRLGLACYPWAAWLRNGWELLIPGWSSPPCVDDRTEEVHRRTPGTITVTDLYCDFNGVSSTHPQTP